MFAVLLPAPFVIGQALGHLLASLEVWSSSTISASTTSSSVEPAPDPLSPLVSA